MLRCHHLEIFNSFLQGTPTFVLHRALQLTLVAGAGVGTPARCPCSRLARPVRLLTRPGPLATRPDVRPGCAPLPFLGPREGSPRFTISRIHAEGCLILTARLSLLSEAGACIFPCRVGERCCFSRRGAPSRNWAPNLGYVEVPGGFGAVGAYSGPRSLGEASRW